MIELSWTDLAAIGTLLVITTAFVVAAMKSVFLTEAKHKTICEDTQITTCKKLEEIKAQIAKIETKREEAKARQAKRDLWLVQAFQKIADKVGADIPEFPH